jgi:hypothetical protein
MFSGGGYEEVARWLSNFVTSHAKRENLRVEAVVDIEGPRQGQSYGIRLRQADELRPRAGESPLELSFAEVASNRGSLAWCNTLAERVRSLAREFSPAGARSQRSA